MKRTLGPLNRVVAAVLAIIWIGAGLAAVALGLRRGEWMPVLLGALAVGFGVVWAGVARTGRYATWPFGRKR